MLLKNQQKNQKLRLLQIDRKSCSNIVIFLLENIICVYRIGISCHCYNFSFFCMIKWISTCLFTNDMNRVVLCALVYRFCNQEFTIVQLAFRQSDFTKTLYFMLPNYNNLCCFLTKFVYNTINITMCLYIDVYE